MLKAIRAQASTNPAQVGNRLSNQTCVTSLVVELKASGQSHITYLHLAFQSFPAYSVIPSKSVSSIFLNQLLWCCSPLIPPSVLLLVLHYDPGQNFVTIFIIITSSGCFVNVSICLKFYFVLDIRPHARFISKDINNLPLVG